MNINPKELQKFHDLWAPMIAALPAVINAAERANELQNHTALLEKELNNVITATEASKAERAAAIVAAGNKLVELEVQRKALSDEVKAHAKVCKTKIASAEEESAAKIATVEARNGELEVALKNVEQALLDRKAKADADYAEHLNAKRTELDDVEAKLASAQKALDKLRAKLE